MALSDVEIVRLRIGDKSPSPFYPLLSDDEIEYVLESVNDDINSAIKICATSAALTLAQMPKREYYDDLVEVETDPKEYLKFLLAISKDPMFALPSNLKPYAAGISKADLCASMNDPDNPRANNFLYNSREKGCC